MEVMPAKRCRMGGACVCGALCHSNRYFGFWVDPIRNRFHFVSCDRIPHRSYGRQSVAVSIFDCFHVHVELFDSCNCQIGGCLSPRSSIDNDTRNFLVQCRLIACYHSPHRHGPCIVRSRLTQSSGATSRTLSLAGEVFRIDTSSLRSW